MRRTLRTGALRSGTLSLLLMSAASVCTGQAGAQAIDCWLLDQDGLARAHERGLCQDAFARNTRAGEPAGGQTVVIPKRHDGEVAAMPPAPSPAKPPPAPAKPKRTTTAHRTQDAPPPAVQPPGEPRRELSSWAVPREAGSPPPAVSQPAGTRTAGIDPPVVQQSPAPPTPDPLTTFANNFQRDFRSLMLKLNEVLSDPPR